ncbi:MAG: 3-methyl-2-oxobutanoate hydroxymethyltransferase [SAR202 cluster bacterium Casp-Chloro-G1]|nr:3-methyl-2-oxobutanoate hydroxymethyltransferase [Chloroflexota bacterium]PKB56592.1 MAG: 3-methyl-2-oxobutanoate hydroxymethyltransferase [SAR202 cluster bacterium Casp-Chloro-G1]
MMTKRVQVRDLQRMRDRGEPITMLTAYDYPTARMADDAGIPILLVGDTLGMVVLGYDSTVPVTLDDMIHHGKAVVRGAGNAHVVVDMPFGTYQAGWQDALRNATRIMQETGCGSVKLEGGQRSAETVQRLVEAGIPVMGHIGLTPQSVNQTSGFRVQGKTPRDAVHLINDAKALAEAGAYAIVLELVPTALAQMITQRVPVPTIGIGAGPFCSGQVQVWHDILGLYDDLKPRHARRFAELGVATREAIGTYREQVEARQFPTADESFYMDEHALELIKALLPELDGDLSDAQRILAEHDLKLIARATETAPAAQAPPASGASDNASSPPAR